MSRYWLKRKIVTDRELAAIAFRTSGDSGHWRLPAAFFDAWAERWTTGADAPKPLVRRGPRRRRLRVAHSPGKPINLMDIYYESIGQPRKRKRAMARRNSDDA